MPFWHIAQVYGGLVTLANLTTDVPSDMPNYASCHHNVMGGACGIFCHSFHSTVDVFLHSMFLILSKATVTTTPSTPPVTVVCPDHHPSL